MASAVPLRVAVTGAGGKTGRAVIVALLAAGHRVRALVHRQELAATVVAAGAEVVVGDQRRPDDLVTLLADCAALYHIPPNLSADEEQMVTAALTAADRQGTRRVIYHSVLHPQTSAMPHHRAKLAVEDRLLTSGLETVFLQPAPYLQNLEPYVRRAAATGAVAFPYSPDVVLSMVHLADVAAAAVAVVTGVQHVGAAYQLCGPDVMNQGAAWRVLSARCGLGAVVYRRRPPSAWVEKHTPLQGRERAWLTAMFDYYDRHGLRGTPLPLQALIGREPFGLDTFAEQLATGVAHARGL